MDVVCGLLQPMVDMLQSMVAIFYVPLNFFGIQTPPVASWFEPFLPCTLDAWP
jgi:hypothetical protein